MATVTTAYGLAALAVGGMLIASQHETAATPSSMPRPQTALAPPPPITPPISHSVRPDVELHVRFPHRPEVSLWLHNRGDAPLRHATVLLRNMYDEASYEHFELALGSVVEEHGDGAHCDHSMDEMLDWGLSLHRHDAVKVGAFVPRPQWWQQGPLRPHPDAWVVPLLKKAAELEALVTYTDGTGNEVTARLPLANRIRMNMHSRYPFLTVPFGLQ